MDQELQPTGSDLVQLRSKCTAVHGCRRFSSSSCLHDADFGLGYLVVRSTTSTKSCCGRLHIPAPPFCVHIYRGGLVWLKKWRSEDRKAAVEPCVSHLCVLLNVPGGDALLSAAPCAMKKCLPRAHSLLSPLAQRGMDGR